MLSNTCKYAIRAVIYLAVNDDNNIRIGIKKISDDLNLPAPFLGKILQLLAKNKILVSTKGPHGGFSLGKKASEISLLDIVEIIDSKEVFQECIIGMKICKGDINHMKLCPFYPKSHPVRDELFDLFKNQTIEEFVVGINNSEEIMTI